MGISARILQCRQTHAAAAVVGALLLAGSGTASGPGDPARPWLGSVLGLDAKELARIDAGEVVARTLDADDSREVGTLGIVRVRLTPEFYAARLADIENFKRADAVLQIGTFGTPATLDDVHRLTLEPSDVRSLRDCRVGDCNLQLPAAAIERFRSEIDWSAPADTANRILRETLVEYVTAYRRSGAAALMQYADESTPSNLRLEFDALMASDVVGVRHFPVLVRHLLEYPRTTIPGAQDLIYWSKETVARKRVISLTHVAIIPTAGQSAADFAIASMQIYGSHYYEASLGLTILLRDRFTEAPATYVVYVNRSRVDAFGGLLGGITRSIVRSRARSTVSEHLSRIRTLLERQFAGGSDADPSV